MTMHPLHLPTNSTANRRCGRVGLATLELVLCLPILLFIMALMINAGTKSSWKVRGALAARHAVWASRWPRNFSRNPRPDYWPPSANMGTGGGNAVVELDHPAVNLPVARGPAIFNTKVNSNLLDPARGYRNGSSNMTRSYPLLAAGLGDYRLPSKTGLLDNNWQFQRMGLSWTRQRRIPVLFTFPQTAPTYATAYVNAALAIYNAPFRPDLFPLDRDDEFIGYARRFGWGNSAPDFHPNLKNCCGLGVGNSCCYRNRGVTFCCTDNAVARQLVDDLVDRIQGKVVRNNAGNVVRKIPCVAENMARAFIRLYRRVILELEAQISPPPPTPPPPPAQIAVLQAEIDDLEAKIALLTAYLQTF